MASMMTITVLCPHGRRQTIKASSNTSVLEVLEETCRKQGLRPDDFDIKHYDKFLDLSLSMRFANLPNNAMLELSPIKSARREGSVTVAVQMESGERFTSDFSPSSLLSDVISKSVGSRSDMTMDSVSDAVPVCIYMRQKFMGDQIKTTTLRSLGLTSGKAIIRLIYRPPNSLSEQAHITSPLSKPPPQKVEKDDSESYATKKPASTDLNFDHAVKHPRLDADAYNNVKRCSTEQMQFHPTVVEETPMAVDEPMQCDTTTTTQNDFNSGPLSEMLEENGQTHSENDMEATEECNKRVEKEIGEIKYLGSRNAVLFNLEDIWDIKRDEFPDEFFELTVNDVRYLMDEYKRIRSEMENEPLMLRRQRENRMLQQLACYRQSVIRIYFPDQLVLQGTFFADETVQSVMDFVQNFLENKQLNFYLYIAPPKAVLPQGKTLLEMRLVPAAVVYFGCDVPNTSYLRAEIRSQVSDPRAATKAAAECRKKQAAASLVELPNVMNAVEERVENVPAVTQVFHTNNPQRTSSSNQPAKVPAWFKLGNK